jgi:hypothetical protein
LLTFCPPGPWARTARSSISAAGIATLLDTFNMDQPRLRNPPGAANTPSSRPTADDPAPLSLTIAILLRLFKRQVLLTLRPAPTQFRHSVRNVSSNKAGIADFDVPKIAHPHLKKQQVHHRRLIAYLHSFIAVAILSSNKMFFIKIH